MADILYKCPRCPQHLRAETEHVGGTVVCPRCQHPTQIPPAVADYGCPRCHTPVRVAISAMGESFRCSHCAGDIPVPLLAINQAGVAQLQLQGISLELTQNATPQRLLHEIGLQLPGGHLAAIVGASGCGKTTLLKIIAGIMEPTAGTVSWQGRDLAVEDLAPTEIGYVPQFSILYEYLTIWESMETALRLRVAGLGAAARRERIEMLLHQVGLLDIAQRQVRVLSGGERRRLTLALESATLPALLLCDEVTSGLDPKAEEEVVGLMHQLARDGNRLVISVTHSLRQLARYDSVAVLYRGHLAFHGQSQRVAEYFGVNEPGQTFNELEHRPALEWHELWQRRQHEFALPPTAPIITPKPAPATAAPSPADSASFSAGSPSAQPQTATATALGDPEPTPTEPVLTGSPRSRPPNPLVQATVLVQRRARIFWRDRGHLLLHAALLFGFPCLVVIFAWNGLPQMQQLSMGPDVSPVQQLKESASYLLQSSRVGGLVSGLVMFQVILLALMAANNAAREVAAERLIFEKEKLGGLSPLAYLASKVAFLAGLVALQSIWMALFVNLICRFPGELAWQCGLLLLGNAALTAAALGISSLLKSPEQASLVAIYLVGFQIPLSGAFLALPGVLGVLTRPFVAAYWSWSGVIETMRDTRFYDAVQLVTQTSLSSIPLCVWALVSHVFLGVALAYIGCRRSRWE